MKKFKIIIMVILLIGVFAMSIALCACNKDNQPSGNKDAQPSGNINLPQIDNNGEQLSGGINKNEQPSSDKESQLPVDNTSEWVKINKYGSLSLQADRCSAIVNSKEELDLFCDVDTSSCFMKKTIYDIYPDITDEELENEALINSLVNSINSANDEIIEILKKYNEQFFQEKSIVVLFRVRGSSGHYYKFKECEVDGNALNITLSMTIPKESVRYPADMATFVYIMEFDKEKVDGVTQINVEDIQENEK